jgi:hypothetical protein
MRIYIIGLTDQFLSHATDTTNTGKVEVQIEKRNYLFIQLLLILKSTNNIFPYGILVGKIRTFCL